MIHFLILVRDNPTWIKTQGIPSFFYDGNCNDPNVQSELKKAFITFLKDGYIPPMFCSGYPCSEDNTKIYCGETDAASRRRKRRNTKKV